MDEKEVSQSAICFAACLGCSNVSLLAYKAVSTMDQEGYGKFVWLAGEQAKEKDFERLTNAAKNAKEWILIEGCSKGCGQKALESAEIKPDKQLLVTSLGIERENDINYSQDELELVLSAVKGMLD